jgi:hypothetical protein
MAKSSSSHKLKNVKSSNGKRRLIKIRVKQSQKKIFFLSFHIFLLRFGCNVLSSTSRKIKKKTTTVSSSTRVGWNVLLPNNNQAYNKKVVWWWKEKKHNLIDWAKREGTKVKNKVKEIPSIKVISREKKV